MAKKIPPPDPEEDTIFILIRCRLASSLLEDAREEKDKKRAKVSRRLAHKMLTTAAGKLQGYL